MDRFKLFILVVAVLALGFSVGYTLGDSRGYNEGYDVGYSYDCRDFMDSLASDMRFLSSGVRSNMFEVNFNRYRVAWERKRDSVHRVSGQRLPDFDTYLEENKKAA